MVGSTVRRHARYLLSGNGRGADDTTIRTGEHYAGVVFTSPSGFIVEAAVIPKI